VGQQSLPFTAGEASVDQGERNRRPENGDKSGHAVQVADDDRRLNRGKDAAESRLSFKDSFGRGRQPIGDFSGAFKRLKKAVAHLTVIGARFAPLGGELDTPVACRAIRALDLGLFHRAKDAPTTCQLQGRSNPFPERHN